MNKKAAILSVVGVYGGAIGIFFVAGRVLDSLEPVIGFLAILFSFGLFNI